MADPSIIVSGAQPGQRILGWRLRAERSHLLTQFKPRYPRIFADHITLATGVANNTQLPEPMRAAIVGHADDGAGVEALVVAINGSTDRPDGGTYHITWSLGAGRKPRESNDVIRECGWTELDRPVSVNLEPAWIR